MSISISSSSMLVDVSIGSWTARRLDRSVTEELNTAKGASKRATRVNKNLLPATTALERITRFGSSVRNWMYTQTLPWSDNGPRLLPTHKFFEFKRQMDEHQRDFYAMVDQFVRDYPNLIAQQSFELGSMFDRTEYPAPSEVAGKFQFHVAYLPIPESGDFRIDIGNEGMADLHAQFEREFTNRLQNAIGDIRQRMLDSLAHLSDRFTDDDDGKRKRFHGTILENFAEVVSEVEALNITKDQAVSEMVRLSKRAIDGVGIDDVKGSPTVRRSVKNRIDEILESMSI